MVWSYYRQKVSGKLFFWIVTTILLYMLLILLTIGTVRACARATDLLRK